MYYLYLFDHYIRLNPFKPEPDGIYKFEGPIWKDKIGILKSEKIDELENIDNYPD